MPSHEDVLDFSKKIAEGLGYKIADDSDASRVVLLSKDGKKRDIV
jgi:tRNA wybutosine-synthesizing protein 1